MGKYFFRFLANFCALLLILISSIFIGVLSYSFLSEHSEELSEELSIPFSNYMPAGSKNAGTNPLNLDEIESTPYSISSSNDSSSDYYTRVYSWRYNGYNQSFNLSIPKEHYDYYRNKSHSGKNYDHYALSEYDRQFLGDMIDGFKKDGQKNGFTDDQIVLNVIAFVQAMEYTSDSVTTGYDEYPRYPIETLVDRGGDCEDSAILAAALLSEMGYGTVLFALPDHMALGVKGGDNLSGTYFEYNGGRYFYVETTSSGFGFGEIPPEYKDAKVQVLTMNPVPAIFGEMSAKYIDYDSDYVYYKVRCDFKNYGSISAQNVNVQIFAEAPPYDLTQIWPPDKNVFIGTVPDDDTGWAESVVAVPRNNYTRFTCLIYGDNFNFVDIHTDVVYID